MKQLIFSFLIFFSAMAATAQSTGSTYATGYEAAGWKLWELTNPAGIICAPPPRAAAAVGELASVKAAMRAVDADKLAQIRYWDAGAPAYRWNQLATAVMPWDKVDVLLRTPLAWVSIAVYDATVLAWKEKIRYKRLRPQRADPTLQPLVKAPPTYSYPCEHTVTAAAAAYVLAYFIPDKGDSILRLARAAAQSRIDAGVQYKSDSEAGWKLGEAVAMQVIESAKKDGSTAIYSGVVNTDPKKWTGGYKMGINLPLYRPIVLTAADQFRPPPPPDFADEMKELKAFKQTFKSRSLAYYWASTGPGLYAELASQKMFEYRMSDDAPAVARIYAVMNTAYHDMAIAIFDAKYAYWGIRPSQYDSTYKPLISTPPFPGYPSGHAAGAGATCAVLEYFFPADAQQFRQMAQDCADSRFYAGIHFKVDNEVALKMGKEIGKFVVQAWVPAARGADRSAAR